jgi:catechol 2,3-dioxygenase-like lactoylglutathione lyase family enzyme
MAGVEGLKGVSLVSIGVSDMDRSRAWYRDVLGWEELFDEHMHGAAFEKIAGTPGASGRACGGRVGDLRIELMNFNFIPNQMSPPGLGLRVLSFEVAEINKTYDAMRKLGVTCVTEPVELHGTRMFFILDPDGQGIEVVEYIAGGPAWGGLYQRTAPPIIP